jgi:hypothetical protein
MTAITAWQAAAVIRKEGKGQSFATPSITIWLPAAPGLPAGVGTRAKAEKMNEDTPAEVKIFLWGQEYPPPGCLRGGRQHHKDGIHGAPQFPIPNSQFLIPNS